MMTINELGVFVLFLAAAGMLAVAVILAGAISISFAINSKPTLDADSVVGEATKI
jgi:hypothetical protein